MADALTDALESLQDDNLLSGTKPNTESFIEGEKDVENTQYPIDDSEKVGFDFEVNLQPEKILEVATLPVSFYFSFLGNLVLLVFFVLFDKKNLKYFGNLQLTLHISQCQ